MLVSPGWKQQRVIRLRVTANPALAVAPFFTACQRLPSSSINNKTPKPLANSTPAPVSGTALTYSLFQSRYEPGAT